MQLPVPLAAAAVKSRTASHCPSVAAVARAPPAVAASHQAAPAAFPTILLSKFSHVYLNQLSFNSFTDSICPSVTIEATNVQLYAIYPPAVFMSLPMILVINEIVEV